MVKKAKEGTILNLYNFNAEDEENIKKVKRTKKNNTKKKAIKKSSTVKPKEDTKFDFNNEIVIGLPKVQERDINNNKTGKKQVKNKKQKSRKQKDIENVKQKNVKKKTTKKKNNKNKVISPKEQEVKNRQRKKKLKIIKYTFLMLSIIAIIIATATSPLFNIKEIKVEGNEKITNDEIISLSQINVNQNTYKTNMKKAEEKILKNPYIKSVKIKRVLPDKVSITVEERKTTFMIEYGSGYVYINNQGYILEVSTQKLEVPILQGAETISEEFVPGNRLCVNDLEKMSTAIKIMEVAESNDISNLITRIDIENKQNYKISFESEQKIAYLGDETDIGTKILSIKSILEKEQGIAGEIFVNMDLKNNYPTFRQNV